MDSTPIPVQDLELLGVEPGLLDELGGTEAMLESGAGIQVPHPGLHEGPEIPGGAVGELHDPAWLPLEEDDVAAADVGGLH
jgi:hypothetical protein